MQLLQCHTQGDGSMEAPLRTRYEDEDHDPRSRGLLTLRYNTISYLIVTNTWVCIVFLSWFHGFAWRAMVQEHYVDYM